MNRIEFIEKLQRTLAGGLGSDMVADNVRYYQDYIDGEMRKGKSEAEVLAALGDPRLLAKSIIEANKHAGVNMGTNRVYDEETSGQSRTYTGGAYSGTPYGQRSSYEENNTYDETEGQSGGGRVFRMPGWLLLLIVTVVVILVISVAFSLLSFFSPIIIMVLVVILLVRVFRERK